MLCIELTRNGKRLATAGLRGEGVLSLDFTCLRVGPGSRHEAQRFDLFALDYRVRKQLTWAKGRLEAGDEFVVRIRDRATADPPRNRFRRASPGALWRGSRSKNRRR
jgi:hypothetical protein